MIPFQFLTSTSPKALTIGLVVVFIAGATIGGNAAAQDEPRPEVVDRVADERVAADGTLAERDRGVGTFGTVASRTPDTPAHAWAEREVIVPMVMSMVRVAGLGSAWGYWSVNTIGVGATKALLNVATLAMMGAGVWQFLGVVRQ